MNISINLDEEQTGALDGLVADYNASREAPVTAGEYLQTVVIGIVNDRVKRNFESVASALVAAAKSAPYAKRQALIATVQSELSK